MYRRRRAVPLYRDTGGIFLLDVATALDPIGSNYLGRKAHSPAGTAPLFLSVALEVPSTQAGNNLLFKGNLFTPCGRLSSDESATVRKPTWMVAEPAAELDRGCQPG